MRLLAKFSVLARICGLVAVFALTGCSGMLNARNPLPANLADATEIPDIPSARFWGDEVPENLASEVRHQFPDLPRLASGSTRIGGRPVVEVLALSGGGPNGAYGAGLLRGWSDRGGRPEFELVTGVSAGALIAPFAFLGPDYDATLEEIWTTYETQDLIRIAGLPGVLGGDGAIDTEPLADLIARYLDRAVLDRIAAEYRRGRILLVQTTNLDAQRPVVWNMGALAASRSPGAAALFHKVILASAAIPGAFPPVRIKVRANGETYDELHVDGGTTRQVFISPVDVPLRQFDVLYDRPPIRRIYLIDNGRQSPVYAPTEQKTLPIVGRAIATLLLSQTATEIYRIYRRVQDAGGDFNYTAIPELFAYQPVEVFDIVYQKKLYDEGRRVGASPNAWEKRPLQLVATRKRPQQADLRPVRRTTQQSLFGATGFFATPSR